MNKHGTKSLKMKLLTDFNKMRNRSASVSKIKIGKLTKNSLKLRDSAV